MAENSGGGYYLRSRKRMVPDTNQNRNQEKVGADNAALKTGNHAANNIVTEGLVEVHLDGNTPKPNKLLSSNSRSNHDVMETNIDAIENDDDEEDVLFDQHGDSRPLLASSGSPKRSKQTSSPREEMEIAEGDVIIQKKETWFGIGLQVFFPYIIAGFGTVGAGMVLDIVQVSKIS